MELNEKWRGVVGEEGDPGAGMRLASAGAPQGGPGAGLQADPVPWTTAGGVAGALRTSAAASLTDLETALEGLAAATAGFGATAAVEGIRTGWKDRLTSGRDECGRLDGALRSAGRDFGERETTTRDTMRSAVPEQPTSGG
ncbi:hypothetical protein ACFXCZ_07835 [Streptomyces sp. NPDC059396]|uniref:hypothetical protein n=1 Tax=Streptomyces sp. NPDC059396 TaxID=3346819 RepID=UPI0036B79E4B